jgi:hypothetical protein
MELKRYSHWPTFNDFGNSESNMGIKSTTSEFHSLPSHSHRGFSPVIGIPREIQAAVSTAFARKLPRKTVGTALIYLTNA